ncbi:MAG: hypothetical protein QF445_04130 [Candidatus Poseidoniaceae archaeon]|nr:hypothetical protein [Candidatus Poseidoniaceae archaeon]
MPLKSGLKKYPELGLKLLVVIFAILSFYFAKTLNQRESKSMLIIESLLIISLCFSILYIITASIKLLKNHEKNLNFGFNLSIVLTFLLTLISFYLESEGWWTFCIGLCSTSDLDLFILLAQPFVVPVALLLLTIIWPGDWPKKRFFFGVMLSIPFCVLATFFSGSTLGIILYAFSF